MVKIIVLTEYHSVVEFVELLVRSDTTFVFTFAEVQVKSAFSSKESVQREVKATLSQRATLSCEVADSKTEVKWYKDGKLLASTKAIHSEAKGKNRQLVIESLEKKDAGEYICEAGTEKLVFKIQVEGKIHVTFLSVLRTF